MEPPEDVKVNFANELYGESLHLSKPDGSIFGDSDEEPNEALEMDREAEHRRRQFHSAGYRDGIIAGKEVAAQEGYNIGYKESVLAGYKFGIVRGVSSALAFLPDELKEKLSDEQETRDKFQELHKSVDVLSTESAMKLLYETLTAKQGEEKSGEDLESYVTKLSSLLDKSPKIEVKLDT